MLTLSVPYLYQKPVSDQEIKRKTHLSLGEELLDYVWYFIKIFAVVLITYLFVKDSLFRNFEINGLSMAPNYADRDLVYVNKLARNFGDIKRGDVVVFREPDDRCPKTTTPNACFLIKRIIGLPGETLFTKDGGIFVINREHPEGIKLDETGYLKDSVKTYADGKSVEKQTNFATIPDKSYFVMGDNRTNSFDSRFSNIGYIQSSQIEGKEFFREGHGFFSLPSYNISNN